MGHRRDQDLDQRGAPRRHDLSPGPYRPGRPGAPGHLVSAAPDAPARCGGAPHPRPDRQHRRFRRGAVQRGPLPTANVLGGEGNGWVVANSTLGFERGVSATTSYRRFDDELTQIAETARRLGRSADPVVRQRLAAVWTDVQLMQFHGERMVAGLVHPETQASLAALQAITKVHWTEVAPAAHRPRYRRARPPGPGAHRHVGRPSGGGGRYGAPTGGAPVPGQRRPGPRSSSPDPARSSAEPRRSSAM